MKNAVLVFFLSFINHAIFAQTEKSLSDFDADFKILRKALTDTHPSLYRFSSRQTVEAVFDSIENKITDKTTQLDFFRMISRVESLVREGHTFIQASDSLSKNIQQQKIFPFDVTLNGPGLVVTRARSSSCQSYEGAIIKSINGKSAEAIISKIGTSSGHKSGNNNSGLLDILSIEDNFAVAYYYFVDTTSVFDIEYTTSKDSNTIKVRIDGVKENSTPKPFPTFPKEPDPPIQFNIIDNNTALLKVTTFAFWTVSYNRREYLRTFAACFKKIKKSDIKNLIVDVRNNRGGDDLTMVEFMRYLLNENFTVYQYIKAKTTDFGFVNGLPEMNKIHFWDKDYVKTDSGYYLKEELLLSTFSPQGKNHFKGNLYILANGGSRSAASTFLVMMRTQNRGIIVGQESGGIYNDVDGHIRANFRLPHSGIRVSFPVWSLKINSDNRGDRQHGVVPDHIVKRTPEDILRKRDVETMKALELISKN